MQCREHVTGAEKLTYFDWHERAHKAHAKGVRQRQCQDCGRWFFPFEMRGAVLEPAHTHCVTVGPAEKKGAG